jgi:hypothetical protein
MILNIVWGPPASRAQVVRFHSTLTHGEAMLTDDGGVGSDSHAWKYWGEAVRPGGWAGPGARAGTSMPASYNR